MAATEPNQCPQCGKFVGDGAIDNPGKCPGFGDASIPGHTDLDHGAEFALFCNEECADRFHGRAAGGSR